MKRFDPKIWLISLLAWNGLTAMAGGLGLMTGLVAPPLTYLNHTGFSNYYFPGVILFAIVGGSALIAALALLKHAPDQATLCVVSAVIMLIWIIGEIVSIREFHWLQAIYLVTAGAIIWLIPPDSINHRHE